MRYLVYVYPVCAALTFGIWQHSLAAGKKFGITLMVRVDNPTAQVLYLKNGYRVESVLHEYFGPEKNGLYMRKESNGKA